MVRSFPVEFRRNVVAVLERTQAEWFLTFVNRQGVGCRGPYRGWAMEW